MQGNSTRGIGIALLAVGVSGVAAAISIARVVSPPAIAPAAQTESASASGCNGCGSGETGTAVGAGLTGDSAARMARMENEIARHPKATSEDAEYLHDCAHAVEDVFVQRWAIAMASDRLARDRYEPDARETLESVIIDALYHTNWRVRRVGLTTAQESGLTAREDVAKRVRELRDDDRPEVAARASYVPLAGDPPVEGAE